MNDYARILLQNKIGKVLSDAKVSGGIEHPYLNGHLKESFISNLIRPLLNSQYSLGSGKITDYKGAKSKEIDIVIYSNLILPPFFFHEEERIKVYPIESALKCIEIKSLLDKKAIESIYDKNKHLEDNLVSTSGFFDHLDIPVSHVYTKLKYEIFAFSCSAKTDFRSYFLSTYSKIDPLWDSDPLITNICVANRGWLAFTNTGWKYLSYDNVNNKNEEIIGYLCALVHGLEKIVSSRGYPRIGQYLIKSPNNNVVYKNIPFNNARSEDLS